MNSYWKYNLGLAAQILVAAIIYGGLVLGLSFWKGNPEWPADTPWVLGIGSAALLLAIGWSALGIALLRDRIREARS